MSEPLLENLQQLPVLDEPRLAELERAIGRGQLDHLLQILATEALSKPPVIWRLVALGQSIAASIEGHALKGAALGVGALRLSESARAVETIETADDPDSLLAALSEAAHDTLTALKERANRKAAA